MSLSNRDRKALQELAARLRQDDPQLAAFLAIGGRLDSGGKEGPSLRLQDGSISCQPTAGPLWTAITLQLLASIICMKTDSMLVVLAMLGVVAASLIPLARAGD